jgi:hypothetical protein
MFTVPSRVAPPRPGQAASFKETRFHLLTFKKAKQKRTLVLTPNFVSHRLQSSGVNAAKPILLISLFLCTRNALAQTDDKEPAAVIELGAAADRSLTEGQSSFGPTVAVEATPIENWLELEAGVTPLFRRHSTEWSIDLLFKKPWTLSDKMEFMLGIGPEWIHTNEYGIKMNSVAAEVAPDFMFWPSRRHRLGWYLEPSYEYKFGPGHEHSLGITGGLLIGIP